MTMRKIGASAVGLVSDAFRAVQDINTATLSGAIDIIVVEHEEADDEAASASHRNSGAKSSSTSSSCKKRKTYKSSPFHVKFGKLQLLKSTDRIVSIKVNGEPVDLTMKLSRAGKAYFPSNSTPLSSATPSPMATPTRGLSPSPMPTAASASATAPTTTIATPTRPLPPFSLGESGGLPPLEDQELALDISTKSPVLLLSQELNVEPLYWWTWVKDSHVNHSSTASSASSSFSSSASSPTTSHTKSSSHTTSGADRPSTSSRAHLAHLATIHARASSDGLRRGGDEDAVSLSRGSSLDLDLSGNGSDAASSQTASSVGGGGGDATQPPSGRWGLSSILRMFRYSEPEDPKSLSAASRARTLPRQPSRRKVVHAATIGGTRSRATQLRQRPSAATPQPHARGAALASSSASASASLPKKAELQRSPSHEGTTIPASASASASASSSSRRSRRDSDVGVFADRRSLSHSPPESRSLLSSQPPTDFHHSPPIRSPAPERVSAVRSLDDMLQRSDSRPPVLSSDEATTDAATTAVDKSLSNPESNSSSLSTPAAAASKSAATFSAMEPATDHRPSSRSMPCQPPQQQASALGFLASGEFRMSLCGDELCALAREYRGDEPDVLMKLPFDMARAFGAAELSFDEFNARSAELIDDRRLVIEWRRCLYPMRVLTPLLMSHLMFGRPLDEKALTRLELTEERFHALQAIRFTSAQLHQLLCLSAPSPSRRRPTSTGGVGALAAAGTGSSDLDPTSPSCASAPAYLEGAYALRNPQTEGSVVSSVDGEYLSALAAHERDASASSDLTPTSASARLPRHKRTPSKGAASKRASSPHSTAVTVTVTSPAPLSKENTSPGALVSPEFSAQAGAELVPPSEVLESLSLKYGRNEIEFSVVSALQGRQIVEASIFLWKSDAKVVVSDVDGTITKSDVLGQIIPHIPYAGGWSHYGVDNMLRLIADNGYKIVYLTARPIGQAATTRTYVYGLNQGRGQQLPDGPLLMAPDGLFTSFTREVIRRRPQDFKIPTLRQIVDLFPRNPFYAGFGNRITDSESYLAIGVPSERIFIVDPKGDIITEHRGTQKTYRSLAEVCDSMFPDVTAKYSRIAPEFKSHSFWRGSIMDIDELDYDPFDENEGNNGDSDVEFGAM